MLEQSQTYGMSPYKENKANSDFFFSKASIKEMQVWRSQFGFQTKKPSFFEKLSPLKVWRRE